MINNEWYWNLNLHRDRLSLANHSAIDGVIMPTSAAFYTSAVLTDVGICVGMRNVNLNCENEQHCFYPRKIPNCYPNDTKVNERIKETWDFACNQYRLASHETNVNDSTHLYSHRSNINSTAYMMPMTYHQSSSPIFDSKQCNLNGIHSFDENLSNSTFINCASITNSQQYYPVINGDHPSIIQNNSDSIEMYYDGYNGSDRSFYDFSNNIETNSGHEAPPKKKWIRDYMLSKFQN